jgi:intracellular septation protein A
VSELPTDRLPALASDAVGGEPKAAERHIVTLPSVRSIATRTARHVVEAMIVPLGLFYLLLTAAGLSWALLAALVWSFGAIVRHVAARQRIPGVLLLGTALFTVRCVISFATHSVFVYFLQPTLGTYLVAGLFLVSALLGRPLAERLAHDFCPLPESLLGRASMRRFFHEISLLWALVFVANATTTLGLLMSQSVGSFLVFKSVGSATLTVAAIGASYWWFLRSMYAENIQLRWAWR